MSAPDRSAHPPTPSPRFHSNKSRRAPRPPARRPPADSESDAEPPPPPLERRSASESKRDNLQPTYANKSRRVEALDYEKDHYHRRTYRLIEEEERIYESPRRAARALRARSRPPIAPGDARRDIPIRAVPPNRLHRSATSPTSPRQFAESRAHWPPDSTHRPRARSRRRDDSDTAEDTGYGGEPDDTDVRLVDAYDSHEMLPKTVKSGGATPKNGAESPIRQVASPKGIASPQRNVATVMSNEGSRRPSTVVVESRRPSVVEVQRLPTHLSESRRHSQRDAASSPFGQRIHDATTQWSRESDAESVRSAAVPQRLHAVPPSRSPSAHSRPQTPKSPSRPQTPQSLGRRTNSNASIYRTAPASADPTKPPMRYFGDDVAIPNADSLPPPPPNHYATPTAGSMKLSRDPALLAALREEYEKLQKLFEQWEQALRDDDDELESIQTELIAQFHRVHRQWNLCFYRSSNNSKASSSCGEPNPLCPLSPSPSVQSLAQSVHSMVAAFDRAQLLERTSRQSSQRSSQRSGGPFSASEVRLDAGDGLGSRAITPDRRDSAARERRDSVISERRDSQRPDRPALVDRRDSAYPDQRDYASRRDSLAKSGVATPLARRQSVQPQQLQQLRDDQLHSMGSVNSVRPDKRRRIPPAPSQSGSSADDFLDFDDAPIEPPRRTHSAKPSKPQTPDPEPQKSGVLSPISLTKSVFEAFRGALRRDSAPKSEPGTPELRKVTEMEDIGANTEHRRPRDPFAAKQFDRISERRASSTGSAQPAEQRVSSTGWAQPIQPVQPFIQPDVDLLSRTRSGLTPPQSVAGGQTEHLRASSPAASAKSGNTEKMPLGFRLDQPRPSQQFHDASAFQPLYAAAPHRHRTPSGSHELLHGGATPSERSVDTQSTRRRMIPPSRDGSPPRELIVLRATGSRPLSPMSGRRSPSERSYASVASVRSPSAPTQPPPPPPDFASPPRSAYHTPKAATPAFVSPHSTRPATPLSTKSKAKSSRPTSPPPAPPPDYEQGADPEPHYSVPSPTPDAEHEYAVPSEPSATIRSPAPSVHSAAQTKPPEKQLLTRNDSKDSQSSSNWDQLMEEIRDHARRKSTAYSTQRL